MRLWKASFINTRTEAIGTSCYFAERLVLAEAVEKVPRVGIFETMIQNPGRC